MSEDFDYKKALKDMLKNRIYTVSVTDDMIETMTQEELGTMLANEVITRYHINKSLEEYVDHQEREDFWDKKSRIGKP